MKKDHFSFRQFTIYHDRCAMKVGTDGVLLGAWAKLDKARQVLDIGTGSGLIALMAAQRSKAQICAIEIDAEAATQARENADASPWANRIHIIQADIKQYTTEERFDAILSNPPYFANALKSPNKERSTARHTDSLSFEELINHAARLLHPEGELSIIIPADCANQLVAIGISNRLYPSRKLWVHTTPEATAKRCLLALRFIPTERVEEEHIYIRDASGNYSSEYLHLTYDFYTHLS